MRMCGRAVRSSAAAFLALFIAVPLVADAGEHASAAVVQGDVLSHIGIFNFGQVSQAYYRGGELKGRDAADLATLGVKTVIDLRGDDYDPAESQAVSAAGLKYVRMPMTTHTPPTAQEIANFLAIVTNPASQPVYVHCVEGRHRTGVMTAIYRMNVDRWTAARAFSEMKQYKFGLDFLHPEFKRFVYGYHPLPAATPATQVAAATEATN